MHTRLLKKILLAVTFFICAQPLYAQVADTFDVTITPENPGANQTVTIELKSFSTDLGQATILWALNNKLSSKGAGQTSFTFNTGPLGAPSLVSITVEPKGAAVMKKDLTITPASVDLLWQTNTYTPPFYKGKALYTPQSIATFVAVPRLISKKGTLIEKKNIIFTWKKDYIVQGSLSGYGKDSFSFDANVLLKPSVVEVEVSAPAENIKANASLSISTGKPEALIYEDDPLYGILYNSAIQSSFTLANDETKLVAAPYYFSTDSSGVKNLQYSWTVDSGSAEEGTDKSIILRHEGSTGGRSNVSLSIDNALQFFQKAALDISVNFGPATAGAKPFAF